MTPAACLVALALFALFVAVALILDNRHWSRKDPGIDERCSEADERIERGDLEWWQS